MKTTTTDHRALGTTSALDSAVAKIFRRIVPIFAIMMLCNQLNRSNIGYAQEHLEARPDEHSRRRTSSRGRRVRHSPATR
ncbi:hypothetical protein [Saccharopolyspora hattusasensis]|uniref:hypothetical protein n=1 Tax=Saccharopolyspora hattusasensis TaxID=1128679 RepID=UPI003D97E87C